VPEKKQELAKYVGHDKTEQYKLHGAESLKSQ